LRPRGGGAVVSEVGAAKRAAKARWLLVRMAAVVGGRGGEGESEVLGVVAVFSWGKGRG